VRLCRWAALFICSGRIRRQGSGRRVTTRPAIVALDDCRRAAGDCAAERDGSSSPQGSHRGGDWTHDGARCGTSRLPYAVSVGVDDTVYGAGYGLFPICWIILPVIFLYQLTVKTGRFQTLQYSLTNITDDGRLQLLLIAFALGAFIEGAGGFGAPVAVCGRF